MNKRLQALYIPAIAIGALLYMSYSKRGKWSLPKAGERFAADFKAASAQFDLPANLLARVAFQESHFRPDIISGSLTSSAGAVGLMQIIPKWHPGVDPTDPVASIYYAAAYLYRLNQKYGNWSDALAAYNWGPKNLDQNGFVNAPPETRKYVSQIAYDVGVA